MLLLAYFLEGVVRGCADAGTSAQRTLPKTALSIAIFITVIEYAPATLEESSFV